MCRRMKLRMASASAAAAFLLFAFVGHTAAAAAKLPAFVAGLQPDSVQPPLGLRGAPPGTPASPPGAAAAASPAATTSGDAITLSKWAGLKAAIDRVASQVRQVLLVRTDMAMLQEDLTTQEAVWHKAEADLANEIALLSAQANLLQEQVNEGAHVYDDVKHLRENITDQHDMTSRAEVLYEHDAEKAKLERGRLEERLAQLEEYQAKANKTGAAAIQRARDGELQASEEMSRLERAAGEAKYRLADQMLRLRTEQAEAIAKEKELRAQLANLNTTALHMEEQMKPAAQQASELAAIEARLKQETLAIVQVQTEAVQVEANCKVKVTTVQSALAQERAKAQSRHEEMVPVCNAASQKNIVLQQLLVASCGAISGVAVASAQGAPAPAGALAPAPAAAG